MRNQMVTYWDLSEQERAALIRDDVARFIDAELMLKGVLKATPLVLLAETPPALPARPLYVIDLGTGAYSSVDLAFQTEADARAVLAMGPLRVTSDHSLGSSTKYTKPIAADATISAHDFPTAEDVEIAKVALREAHAAEGENQRRREAHERQTKAVDDALKGLWEDWHECTEKGTELRKVAATFGEYTKIANDNEVAASFLRKVFDEDKIQEAEKWCGVVMTFCAVSPS